MDTTNIILAVSWAVTFIVAIYWMRKGNEYFYRYQAVNKILQEYVNALIEKYGEDAKKVLQEVLQAEVDAIEKEKK